ncbi:MAG: hypothetical protein ACYCOU_20645 [Sulfobacillus sp.]
MCIAFSEVYTCSRFLSFPWSTHAGTPWGCKKTRQEVEAADESREKKLREQYEREIKEEKDEEGEERIGATLPTPRDHLYATNGKGEAHSKENKELNRNLDDMIRLHLKPEINYKSKCV